MPRGCGLSQKEVTAQLAQKAKQSEVDGANARIDNLVLESGGDSNIEVADSRQSATKNKTFNVLGARLEDIEKDTFYPIKNIIANGNFEGTTGWVNNYGTITALDNTAILTGDGSGIANRLSQTISLVSGNSYYVKAKVRVTNEVAKRIAMSIYDAPGTSIVEEVVFPINGEWYELSGIITAKNTTSSARLLFQDLYTDATTQTGKVMEVQYVNLIDLTTNFGVGNEPNIEQTKKMMNQFPNYWFDGVANAFNGKSTWDELNRLDNEKGLKTELIATNLLKNGNFEGATDWINEFGALSVANNIATLTGDGSGTRNRLKQGFSTIRGHNYYLKAKARVTNSDALSLNLSFYNRSYGTRIAKEIKEPKINEWYEISGITFATDTAAGAPFFVYDLYNDEATQNGNTMEVQYVLAIDLTDIFGENNEPSFSFVDRLINNLDNSWFSDTKNIYDTDWALKELIKLNDEKENTFNVNKKIGHYEKEVFKPLKNFNSTYFRIPAGLRTNSGTLIAFSQVQYGGKSDYTHQDVSISRSFDGGLTWKDKQIIVSASNNESRIANPTTIYDENLDKIILFVTEFFTTEETSWWSITDDSLWDMYVLVSDDDGETWSKNSIKDSIISSRQPDWTVTMAGLGTGVKMNDGTYVVAAEIGFNDGTTEKIQNGLLYSTDLISWTLSFDVIPAHGDEANIVLMDDGSIMLNARNYGNIPPKYRAIFITSNLGAIWQEHSTHQTIAENRPTMGHTFKINVNGDDYLLLRHSQTEDLTRKKLGLSLLNFSDTKWNSLGIVYKNEYDGYSCLAYNSNFQDELYAALYFVKTLLTIYR